MKAKTATIAMVALTMAVLPVLPACSGEKAANDGSAIPSQGRDLSSSSDTSTALPETSISEVTVESDMGVDDQMAITRAASSEYGNAAVSLSSDSNSDAASLVTSISTVKYGESECYKVDFLDGTVYCYVDIVSADVIGGHTPDTANTENDSSASNASSAG